MPCMVTRFTYGAAARGHIGSDYSPLVFSDTLGLGISPTKTFLFFPSYFSGSFLYWRSENSINPQHIPPKNFISNLQGALEPYTTTIPFFLWIQHKCRRVYCSPAVFYYYFDIERLLPAGRGTCHYLNSPFPPSNPVEAANKMTPSTVFRSPLQQPHDILPGAVYCYLKNDLSLFYSAISVQLANGKKQARI